MSSDSALPYVTFLAEKLGLPLTEAELRSAAERAITKQQDLAPLYAALADAPVEGAIAFAAPAPHRPTSR